MPVNRETIYYINDRGQLIRKTEGGRFIRRGLQAGEEIMEYRLVKDNLAVQKAIQKYEKETGKKYDDKIRWLYTE